MRTSEEVYHRVRWDPRFDPARFVLGVTRRGTTPKRMPLPAFVPGGEIPWHRIVFIEADGELVWDRATGLDRIDASRAGRVHDPRRLRAPFFTALTPYAWDPAADWSPAPWSPAASAPAPESAAGLRVLTWNTLWDRYDSDRIDTARRRPRLLAALEESGADVIALQEVEPALLALIAQAPWIRAQYTLHTEPTAAAVDDDGLLLLSRLPVREAARHELGPHKGVIAVTVETATGPLVVAATHLSSDHSTDGATRRDSELTDLAEGLAETEGPVVLLGDFNDGDAGDRGPAVALGLRDAWTEAHGPHDHTPTFDPRVNPLAAVSSLSGRAARLDRVLLRTDESSTPHVTAADLVGEVPEDDGLFISDHFGVRVDLGLGGDDRTDVLDTAPTARTALAWLPPRELWPPLQDLRQRHDPQFHRWPPHVNVLFGFVPESDFERAAPLIAAALADVRAFTARLDGVDTFGHREDATVWLDPAAAGDAPWAELRHALVRRFPRCRGRAEGFTPHLTLGRAKDPQRVAAECAARLDAVSAPVGELVLLSRRGGEPMGPRAVFTLGGAEVRWLPDAEEDPASGRETDKRAAQADRAAPEVARRVAEALPEGVVHLVGSRRMGCALPGTDLDLVAALPAVTRATRARFAASFPDAVRLRNVTGARVPGLRFAVGALDVDLVLVPTEGLPPDEAVACRAELGASAGLALSAVSDADAVRTAVADLPEFPYLARRVKAWAKARGLDAAPFGGLPGVAWAVLAARTAADAKGFSGDELVRQFFADWAAWDWRNPVGLSTPPQPLPQAPVTVLTPTAPVRNCAEQVSAGWRDLLTQELYRAWEILESGAGGEALLAPPDLHRRHAAWAVVTVRPTPDAEFDTVMGRVRGRFRALLSALEDAGTTDAHAWPRPVETGPDHARYAIGLGRTPPDKDRLAEIAHGWLKGLSGTEVTWARNGEVPTLR
ncbi:MAG: DUF504 domain-containing protein [Streptomycetaceae bacterium]|nr:DUF504 domain-containing protein [Streptomycetaceae bacterium]